ncbi:tripartite tricarboxylate transporter substrate binding protein [Lawsonibacter sp. OA9]|jgi:tripartite-type tricarboxylate transporter receptor subunit TctC|uniref:tripartite tricarboxylate transporter substrate binding protein n=1 Tax=Lawsonibacter sp. OA9 TaxID=2914163 RepID=UPI001E15599E|nr:tripartite tricarboxylate transporter substrate binding protein [Lawsonibacter sp. OA9]MBS5591390.1 tripartite tricarboxylate transporter substrate binding protein [Clostridiales bacterium]MCH1978579.1 tripartite tricarboxylate transporter substrate binding protein [Lawsonibacter sp. OA9]
MKKIFAALLACAMTLSLAACSNGSPTPGASSSGGSSTAGSGDQDFAFEKPVTVVVPFKAGSATDNQIRLMQSDLEDALGTTLVIVNSEGGSGTIGTTDYLNSYQPDGYTILYSLATPIVYKPLSGDTAYTYDDLRGVALTSSQPMYLILADTSPFQSAQEVLDYIKSNPGEFTYANVGNGGNGHLAFASFLMGEALEATSVPYTGGTADCYTAMMGGEVDAAVYGEADLLARPECHGVINLGSKSTVESLVDIPTLADLGYEGYETNNMAGFFYHKNVPDAAATAFESAVESVLTDESFVTRATEAGFVPYFASGTKLDEMAHQAMETSQPVIDSLG